MIYQKYNKDFFFLTIRVNKFNLWNYVKLLLLPLSHTNAFYWFMPLLNINLLPIEFSLSSCKVIFTFTWSTWKYKGVNILQSFLTHNNYYSNILCTIIFPFTTFIKPLQFLVPHTKPQKRVNICICICICILNSDWPPNPDFQNCYLNQKVLFMYVWMWYLPLLFKFLYKWSVFCPLPKSSQGLCSGS